MPDPASLASIAHAIVDTVREPLLVLNSELRVQRANRSFYQAFKVAPESTEGLFIFELGNGQWDIPALRNVLETVLPQRSEFNDFEVIHDFQAIGRRVMLLNARRVLQEDRKGGLILLAIEDITERRRLEDERRELETRFTSLVKNIRDHSIFTLDTDGRITSWNAEAERILGYPEDEVLGQHFSIIFTFEDRQAGIPGQEIATALNEGRAEDERWHLRKSGERFWALGIVSPLRDSAGNHIGFSKILRDMTERKLAEEEILESREQLRIALSAAQMGTWLWRIATDEQMVDKNLSRLMGLPEGDRVYSLEQFFQAVHEGDRDRLRSQFDEGLRAGRDINVEFRVVWPDGSTHWLKDQGRVFADADDRPLFMTGACVDITQRKQMEEQLWVADRRKDEYLAVLAHELRNPLAPIRTSIDILRSSEAEGQTGRLLEIMDRQLNHVVRLVDDLLDVSRIRQGKIDLRRERVELKSVVNQAVEASSPWFEDRELSVTLPATPLYLDADATRLAQIIGNLLHNAAKFTETGKSVSIVVQPYENQAVIQVRDQGRGIAQDQQSRIFDMFGQADNSIDGVQSGLGLGLTLVKQLVEMHGGSVEVRSEGIGMGAEFTVRIPIAVEPATLPVPEEKAEGCQLSGRRILVVDDNHDAAASLALLLSKLGNEVRTANDGLAALEAIGAFRPFLVFLDLSMPGMSGYEVAERAQGVPAGKQCILVALTGFSQEEDRRRTKNAGFHHHLVKPVQFNALQALLAEVRGEFPENTEECEPV